MDWGSPAHITVESFIELVLNMLSTFDGIPVTASGALSRENGLG
jgi:hypothetical protein